MPEPIEAREAAQGNKMIEIRVRLWTNDGHPHQRVVPGFLGYPAPSTAGRSASDLPPGHQTEDEMMRQSVTVNS